MPFLYELKSKKHVFCFWVSEKLLLLIEKRILKIGLLCVLGALGGSKHWD